MQGLKITTDDVRRELERRRYNKLEYLFPSSGKYPISKYTKHAEIMNGGAQYRERVFMAGNRVGKSETGAFEVACHLTGIYPDWWRGVRFDKAVNVLVAGETAKLVRDSMQLKLVGMYTDKGTGLIPRDTIIDSRPKQGIPDALDVVYVRHKTGQTSLLQFQSYDQGREAFQATAREFIWLDEEPPLAIYTECLMRTMTTRGHVLSTFTPLKGVSETVMHLRKQAEEGKALVVYATWDDAPHLSEQDKAEMMAALPPFQRDARSKGIPQLGSGAVYPVPETELIVQPFAIPKHWRRIYGLDVGWNNTAACFIAHDPDADCVYVTADYKRGQAEPAVHAAAVKAIACGAPGEIDPASRGRSQKDGEQLINLYRQQGLDITPADNTVEAGIFDVYERMTTGRFKVFSTCRATIEEMRLYRRDDKGRIVKENDHVMDAMRYAVRGLRRAKASLPEKPKDTIDYDRYYESSTWS